MWKIILTVVYIFVNILNFAQPLTSLKSSLNNGLKIPSVGLGTFKMSNTEARRAVIEAIYVGYRHIDTAFYYDNEIGVGIGIDQLINDYNMKREDLFITTKVWENYSGRQRALKGLKISLKNLGLDYVDLALIHWPTGYESDADCGISNNKYSNGSNIPSDEGILQTWAGMQDIYSQGLAKSIGVSNFNIDQLTRIMNGSEIKPAVNQIEIHPFFSNQELIDFCQQNNITVVAYSPLSRGKSDAFNNSVLQEIATKHLKTVAQVMLRWNIQRGVVVIPKTTKKTRMYENLDVFDFQISDEDMQRINALNTNQRIITHASARDHPEYPFIL